MSEAEDIVVVASRKENRPAGRREVHMPLGIRSKAGMSELGWSKLAARTV